jgi:hypothetical protein
MSLFQIVSKRELEPCYVIEYHYMGNRIAAIGKLLHT